LLLPSVWYCAFLVCAEWTPDSKQPFMAGNYKIIIVSSDTWVVPSGSPSPDAPGDLVYVINGINGTGLTPNTPSQNITGTITLEWIPATAPVQAKVTVPKDVLFNADRTKLQQAWEQFLANLDGQSSNQFMAVSGARLSAALLSQNMPMLLAEIAYYRLRFSPSASHYYIDLQPGMRLVLASGNFYSESHSGTGQQSRNFAATGSSYADIQSCTGGNGIIFNSFMTIQNVAVQSTGTVPADNVTIATGILDLASQPVKNYHRLFYPGNFGAGNTASLSVTDSISIVSSYCYASLGQVPNALPVAEACDPLYPKIYPTVFFGRCNVIVQLAVNINGSNGYVSAGTTIKNIIEASLPAESQPRMLQVVRYLNAQKAQVIFPQGNTSSALNMPVLPGDSISWLPTGNFQLLQRVQAIYRITNPSPDALALCKLAIVSFGDLSVYQLPVADDMALALFGSHDKPSPYTSTEIGKALFTNYNSQPFTDPYTGSQLAYSLYFAGFDPVNVAIGVTGSYTPAIRLETGHTLVTFLLQGIGYSVTDISAGFYVALAGSLPANAYYMVKGLIEGSLQYGQLYTPSQVAEGIYKTVSYTVENGWQLAAALMQGSSISEPAKKEYAATDTAPALFYAFSTGGINLTQNNLAMALAKPFFGQALGYPVDQVALGVFSVYPLSDAVTIATSLLNSGVTYSMNDVAKGTYAVKNYPPAPGHILSTEELAYALYNAYGTSPLNTPKAVAIALVYAISNVTPNEVAAATAKVFGYLAGSYTQININTIASAVTVAFVFSGTQQTDVNKTSAALLFAFTNITAAQMANGLVSGFQYPVSGTNLAGMGSVSIGVVTAFAYSKDDQGQVNTTAAALQNAFQVNMQDQPSVTTLARSLAAGLAGISAPVLMNALVKTGNYVKGSQVNVTLPVQAAAVALNYSATNQTQVNTLCAAAKTALTLDGKVQNDASYLSRAVIAVNGNPVTGLINGTALLATFSYSGTVQQDINLLANANVYAYSLKGSVQNDVNSLTSVVVKVFAFAGNNATQVTATATAQKNSFNFLVSNQPDINSSATALTTVFNYPGYGDRTYQKSDALVIANTLYGVFSGITIQQMLPALRSGFLAFLPVDAGTILTALYTLNTSSSTDIALLGSLAGTNYQLTVAPYGVASVSLVLFAPGFSYVPCSGWIGKWYTGWDAQSFQIFNNVFTTPIWAQALVLIGTRQTPNSMAQQLQQGFDQGHTMADEMVRILAACYYYIDLSISIVPVGTAMKTSGYSLVQASGALGNGQYKQQWNASYYTQLVNIYNS
jgi:hypothetical protein